MAEVVATIVQLPRALVVVAAGILLAACDAANAQNRIEGLVVETTRPANWQKQLGVLDGSWQGTLEVIAATPATPAGFWRVGDKPELKLVIDGESAVVAFKAGGWRELRVGDGFRTLKIEASGFVYAVQTANGWVENWNLSATKKDPDTLLVFLSFVAGGTLERIETVNSEFAVGAMGELRRAALPPGAAP
jgi:hypothetical protein